MMRLNNLGKRICIIGPSSSGKSTLAKNLGNKLGVKVFYLDQLAHIPNTNWAIRDKELLRKDHNDFIKDNRYWIIEGNYSFLMKKRFSSATAIIWLDFNREDSLFRYLKRSLANETSLAGNLHGATKQFSLKQMKSILIEAPKNRIKYRNLIQQSKANLIYIDSFTTLKYYYKKWKL